MDMLLAAAESLAMAEMKELRMRPGKIQKLHVKRKRGVFKCEQCSSVFGLRHNLLRHKRTIHEGKRPFKCNVSGCNASFVQRFDLQTHAASVHDKRKDFCCRVCSRAFSQRSNLLTHLRAAHEGVVDLDSDNLDLITSSSSPSSSSSPPSQPQPQSSSPSAPGAPASGFTPSSSTSSSRIPCTNEEKQHVTQTSTTIPSCNVISSHFHAASIQDHPVVQYHRKPPSVADDTAGVWNSCSFSITFFFFRLRVLQALATCVFTFVF